MAETAKILSPNKKVLLPNIKSGCRMADMIDLEQIRKFKSEHPDIPVICYGLRTNYKGELFEGSSTLMALADEINEFNPQSIRSKKSPVQNGDNFFSNQKDVRNFNVINMNQVFDPQQINEQDNINTNMKINTNESIKINSSAINNKFGIISNLLSRHFFQFGFFKFWIY